jgi:hypothetical protein
VIPVTSRAVVLWGIHGPRHVQAFRNNPEGAGLKIEGRHPVWDVNALTLLAHLIRQKLPALSQCSYRQRDPGKNRLSVS